MIQSDLVALLFDKVKQKAQPTTVVLQPFCKPKRRPSTFRQSLNVAVLNVAVFPSGKMSLEDQALLRERGREDEVATG